MGAVELESRAAAIAKVSLASSFLPKCTHLLQAKQSHCPSPSANFHGLVVASTKQKKKGRKSSSPARNWSYEHFMVLWDEVFEHCCTDPVKATKIRDLAVKGLAKHGRGCVLVFQEVQTRPRGRGTGFTSKPPKSSRCVPDFDTLDYHAVYLPRDFLLDPRKAPFEEDVAPHDGAEQHDENAARVVVEKQGDNSDDANNMVERQQKDKKPECGDGSDKVIDIQEVIRDAQDVYSFYSDDEDGLATDDDDDDEDDRNDDDNSTLSLDDREGDTKGTDSLLMLDDKDDDTSITMSQLNLDGSTDKGNGAVTNASDDDNSLRSSDVKQGSKHACYDAMHETRTNPEEEITRNLKLENYSVSRLDGVFLNEDANPLHQQSGMGEVAELLEKGNNIIEVQVVQNGGTHDGCDDNGSVEIRVPAVELLDGNFKADTVESTALVLAEKGDLSYNKQGSKDDEVEIATQQMLYAAMRGMDRTRLLSLTANFDFDIPRFRLKRRMAVIDVKTMDAGGEDPYNPKMNELVLLLHLLMDGRPAYGADVLVAYKDEGDTAGVEKHHWKLRGKYRNIFA